MPLRDWFFGLFDRRGRIEEGATRKRGQATHVIILDGTMSSLKPDRQTNAGQAFLLLQEAGRKENLTVYYEAGIQWRDWISTWDVMTGKGINRQIERAYGVLASRYRPGDRIIFMGYSRGAYAVRSLAGVIDMVGLVRGPEATVRNVRQAYRHYRTGATSAAADRFRARHCHDDVRIEAIGVWDTVKALGLRLPVVWRWGQNEHAFHNHHLGSQIRNGFHALAMDETRLAYAPVLWTKADGWGGHLEQVWFRGTHGDVGGQVGDFPKSRPLANISLVWLLSRIESCGLVLPAGWADRFDQDPTAPSIGAWGGWSKFFLTRRKRPILTTDSETIHPTASGD